MVANYGFLSMPWTLQQCASLEVLGLTGCTICLVEMGIYAQNGSLTREKDCYPLDYEVLYKIIQTQK
jgi:hypothetical protein